MTADPDREHPPWCDPAHCTADGPGFAVHRSLPRRVETHRHGDSSSFLALQSGAGEPCDASAATLVVVAERRANLREIHSYELERYQVAVMAQILLTFAEIMSAT